MKAYELAKKLYPALSKDDFIQETCPDNLMIIDNIKCEKDKVYISDDCVKCWEQEVSDERVKWLIECKNMCRLMGC